MNVLLVVDKYTTVTGATVTYVKQPDSIGYSGECELSPVIHEELVRLAVNMYMQDRFKIPDKESK